MRPRGSSRARRCQHPDPVRPRPGAGPHPHAGAAGDGGGASSPVRQGLRMQTGLVVETGEAREVHHFCCAGGLRRRGDQSLCRLRDAGRDPYPEGAAALPEGSAEELHQGGRQGHPQGHVQDGHFDLPVLLRRADLRRGRPCTSGSPYTSDVDKKR